MKIVAIDFDDTCVINAYPGIGKQLFLVEEVLKRVIEKGNKLILFTRREGVQLEEAKEWFKLREIEIEVVEEDVETFSESHKPYYDYLIDDRSIGIPLKIRSGHMVVDWYELRLYLIELELI